MIGTMDECGVKLLVFSHHHALFAPEVGNQASIRAVRQFPSRLRAYCAINPNYPEFIARDIAAFEQYKDVFVALNSSRITTRSPSPMSATGRPGNTPTPTACCC